MVRVWKPKRFKYRGVEYTCIIHHSQIGRNIIRLIWHRYKHPGNRSYQALLLFLLLQAALAITMFLNVESTPMTNSVPQSAILNPQPSANVIKCMHFGHSYFTQSQLPIRLPYPCTYLGCSSQYDTVCDIYAHIQWHEDEPPSLRCSPSYNLQASPRTRWGCRHSRYISYGRLQNNILSLASTHCRLRCPRVFHKSRCYR
jgi:hypothetical protein